MTKTTVICDICGKDMFLDANSKGAEKISFYITAGGKQLDMCEECKVAIYKRVIHYGAKCKAPAADEVTRESLIDERWNELKKRLKLKRDGSPANSANRNACKMLLGWMDKLEEEKRATLEEVLEDNEAESEGKT